MDEETERRIEEARQAAKRQKETADFLDSLTKNDELVRPVYNPEAWVIRDKARAAAQRGEYPKKNCPHPYSTLRQYVDDDPGVKRKGLPINLYECAQCGTLLWLVDPFGEIKADG